MKILLIGQLFEALVLYRPILEEAGHEVAVGDFGTCFDGYDAVMHLWPTKTVALSAALCGSEEEIVA